MNEVAPWAKQLAELFRAAKIRSVAQAKARDVRVLTRIEAERDIWPDRAHPHHDDIRRSAGRGR